MLPNPSAGNMLTVYTAAFSTTRHGRPFHVLSALPPQQRNDAYLVVSGIGTVSVRCLSNPGDYSDSTRVYNIAIRSSLDEILRGSVTEETR